MDDQQPCSSNSLHLQCNGELDNSGKDTGSGPALPNISESVKKGIPSVKIDPSFYELAGEDMEVEPTDYSINARSTDNRSTSPTPLIQLGKLHFNFLHKPTTNYILDPSPANPLSPVSGIRSVPDQQNPNTNSNASQQTTQIITNGNRPSALNGGNNKSKSKERATPQHRSFNNCSRPFCNCISCHSSESPSPPFIPRLLPRLTGSRNSYSSSINPTPTTPPSSKTHTENEENLDKAQRMLHIYAFLFRCIRDINLSCAGSDSPLKDTATFVLVPLEKLKDQILEGRQRFREDLNDKRKSRVNAENET